MAAVRQLCRQPIVYAVLVAVAVAVVTWLLAIHRPVMYEARLDLLASPRQGADPAALSKFPWIAEPMLAAVVDVGHSSSVLANASAAVPGAPTPAELSTMVVVDVIPASLLTRLSVRASSPDTARSLVTTIAAAIVAKDLISPVGDLRVVDEPAVRRIAPDSLLAAGLSLAAGLAVAVAVLCVHSLIRPSTHQRFERALALAGIRRPVALLDAQQRNPLEDIAVLTAASARPVRVMALTPSSETVVEGLSAALARAGVSMTDNGDDPEVVVGVTTESAVGKLSSAVAALPATAQLIAVVLAAPRGPNGESDQ